MKLSWEYCIMPGKTKGQITSVVRKGFLSVTGDGERNLKELIDDEIRANTRLEYLYKKLEHELNIILPNGQKKILEPIGNHCRGTTFYNAQELITDKLNAIFDAIAQQIQGYNYGRFDIRVPSWEDLYLGKNIKILELNGVSSEVAHIYDPEYYLIRAYKDVAANMKIIYSIARKNHALGFQYDSTNAFFNDLLKHFSLKKQEV